MSTILDALRKVERERDGSPEASLDTPTLTSGVRRGRRFPLAAVAICAVVGFGGGAVLSWWMAEQPPVQTAALPAPPPPPDIPVPRAPVRAHPKAPAPPVAAAEKPNQAPAEAPAPAAPAAAPAAPPEAAPAPAVAPVPPAPAPAPPAVADVKPASPAAAEPAPASPRAEHAPNEIAAVEKARDAAPVDDSHPAEATSREALAALEKQGSALEPSPFAASREPAREPAVSAAPRRPVAVPPPPPERPQQELAAVAPAPAVEPPAVQEPPPLEPEAEPETPPEAVFDTGRSPPGAPKVALSFLQWSADPAKRFAFVSIDGAPSQRVHEGEVAAGLTVSAITPNGIQFKREGGTPFVIRPRH